MLVSAAQRSDSATCTHVSPLAWVSFPSRSAQSTKQHPLSCSAGSHFLLSVGRVYVSVPVSQSVPFPHPLSVSYVSVLPLCLCFANKIISVICFQISHIPIYCCSAPQSSLTSCDPMNCSAPGSLSFAISWSLRTLVPIESVMPSHHLVLCCPLLLLPSVFPSIRVFSNESVLHIRWPKDWSFSFSSSPSNEYSGLISFRMNWFDLLAVQGTLKSLPQHHSSKVSIFWCSAFFIVHLSHPYMTTGKP